MGSFVLCNVLALENFFKVMSWWYYSPARISQCPLPILPPISEAIWNWGDKTYLVDLSLKFRDCGYVYTTWSIGYLISTCKRTPAGRHKPIASVSCWECTLITHVFMATKQTIAWKSLILCFDEVKHCIQGTMINKKRIAILNDTHEKFWLDNFPLSQLTTFFLELKIYAVLCLA